MSPSVGPIRTVTAIRYVTPLREGGSLPAIIEAEDHQLYVLKFRGAGQGPKALIAELIAGEIVRGLGLLVPEIVLVEIDPLFGRSEPDPEIKDLIISSVGLNLALAYLPSALMFDPLLTPVPDATLASAIVWCDAYLTNVDRTPRNPNLLLWQQQLWLIDHGAALYFHHTWANYIQRSISRFPLIKDHVLLPFASKIQEADTDFGQRLTPDLIEAVVEMIPANWLAAEADFTHPDEYRRAYITYLTTRLQAPRAFVEEAIYAHSQCV